MNSGCVLLHKKKNDSRHEEVLIRIVKVVKRVTKSWLTVVGWNKEKTIIKLNKFSMDDFTI